MTNEHENAAAVLATLPYEQAQVLLHRKANEHLCRAEESKPHPFRGFKLSREDWNALRNYVIDGGGTIDTTPLRTNIHRALLHADEQPDGFFEDLLHFVKSELKLKGHVRPVAGGGVIHHGI